MIIEIIIGILVVIFLGMVLFIPCMFGLCIFSGIIEMITDELKKFVKGCKRNGN